MKTCKCGKEFETKYSFQIYCSDTCCNKYSPSHTKSAMHGYKIKQRYGITAEDYNTLFKEQEGCCRLCKRHQSEFKKKLDIDHCHNTNKVRGLLCNQCNQALGLLKENKETIANMLEYVS